MREKANVHARDRGGATALHWAVDGGSAVVLRLLLKVWLWGERKNTNNKGGTKKFILSFLLFLSLSLARLLARYAFIFRPGAM